VQHLDGGPRVVQRPVRRPTEVPNSSASAPSRTDGASSRSSTALASRAVHNTAGRGQASPCWRHAARRNPVSKGALWATSTAPAQNSSRLGSTVPILGAFITMAWVIPVSATTDGAIGPPGSTSVASSPSRSPQRTFTAPTSVIASALALPPVVSRSTTTKVTSRSGVPSSSNDNCGIYRTVGPGSDDSARPRTPAMDPPDTH
jgi:hypothetical protein